MGSFTESKVPFSKSFSVSFEILLLFSRMIFPQKVIETIKKVLAELTALLSPSFPPSSPKHWELSKNILVSWRLKTMSLICICLVIALTFTALSSPLLGVRVWALPLMLFIRLLSGSISSFLAGHLPTWRKCFQFLSQLLLPPWAASWHGTTEMSISDISNS